MTRGRKATPIECLCRKKFYQQYMLQIGSCEHRQDPSTKPFKWLCIMCHAKYRFHSGLHGKSNSRGARTGFGIPNGGFDRLRRFAPK